MGFLRQKIHHKLPKRGYLEIEEHAQLFHNVEGRMLACWWGKRLQSRSSGLPLTCCESAALERVVQQSSQPKPFHDSMKFRQMYKLIADQQ